MEDSTVDPMTASEPEVPAAVVPGEGTLVIGLGDEVVIGGVVVLVSLATLLILLRHGHSQRGLHPDQAHIVEDTRRDMGIEQPAIEVAPDERCPVCLAPLALPVQTNCGHTFCAQCVLSYWRHDQWPRAARCPICRRQVTLLLAGHALREEEGQELWTQVTDYNQRMSGQWRPLMHYLYDVPTILTHMWRNLFTVQGLVLIYRLHILLIIAIVALYLISPFDLLPEVVLGAVGLLDDVLILTCGLVYITILYRAHVANGNR